MDRETRITEHFNCILNLLQENSSTSANAHIEEIFTILTPLQETIRTMSADITHLKEEFSNYQKVSLVKNLNTQLHEKNIEITHLNKKMSKIQKQLDNDLDETVIVPLTKEPEPEYDVETEVDEEVVEEVVEEVEEVVEEVDDESAIVLEDEESISLVEKLLKPKDGGKKRKFFITDDEDKDIYDILENGDPSDEPIGKLVGKNNKSHFF